MHPETGPADASEDETMDRSAQTFDEEEPTQARKPLELVALDLFTAARVTPALMPVAADAVTGLFEPDAIFLSDSSRCRYPEPVLPCARAAR